MSKNNADFFKVKNPWSVIKDRLLQCYLAPYFQKVLTTNKPIFYVDCFAGKGKFEDGNPGSPLIALKVREECLRRAQRQRLQSAIQTCFIDLNYAEDLKRNIVAAYPMYDAPRVIHGKYEDEIVGCLRDKYGYNVFLYIDPYGIKALDSELFDKFQSFPFNTFEMLINFNSFGFFRDACQVLNTDYSKDEAFQDLGDLVEYEPTVVNASRNSEKLLTRIAGGNYWKDIVRDYPHKINGYQAERRLSTEYKRRLRQKYRYVLDMPICLKPGHHPKYRMVHVSNNASGCFLMAQNMLKRKDELFQDIQNDGQFSLFDNVPDMFSSVEGELITAPEIERKVKSFVADMKTDCRITDFIAAFMTEHGLICDFKAIYNILTEMQDEGQIDISRNPAFTKTGKPSAFWEEERRKTVTVRRVQR